MDSLHFIPFTTFGIISFSVLIIPPSTNSQQHHLSLSYVIWQEWKLNFHSLSLLSIFSYTLFPDCKQCKLAVQCQNRQQGHNTTHTHSLSVSFSVHHYSYSAMIFLNNSLFHPTWGMRLAFLQNRSHPCYNTVGYKKFSVLGLKS
jgi:hypothetical protein